ncbi:hypothetical protein COZ40_01510 [Candidatus Roizmanbacteria bacterium CG_4_10_14_3_um_filter_39_13]|uniref:PIN domain-containing protein n=4 Tax=Candidatus Roizmaniibacteriota TaxID=1752723 RepID=A0A2H0KJD3_9BACT|nr:MAG: hypothetical protein COV87_03765 [Candidatus Roizmanbacteria bacterium CG11_big_fil_rev_8_21_14_0_20_37_16]PIV08434.1 MAG: hypothetical protein COS52_02710 [Candidatus Roizmanbacteria bacterium CG03_land_8_20_14_0_80_39_12]PIV70895.1 MAG: hypothetical protein COW57_02715 [Candidatus Roizmanbacteria bacterium CG17_big_fil_post_rev_8_21_14_2_50_39_7]PIX68770.1 MAG: hypothetical protein COZ40_01510 [Candidatus Roizmanbacteria bacterium CG_4_10_14_3_um_filter_39_13]
MNVHKASVFFDASVLFSALYSITGGSFALVKLVKKGSIRGVTSQTVIEELEDNRTKFENLSEKDIDSLVINNNIIVYDSISFDELQPWVGKVEEKDIHVIVGALTTQCVYLVTLDKKHLHNAKTQALCPKIQILSPKELLLQLRKKE